ncbi:MAG TPA: FKBP-type peptidyl-prolyl cis-trans isomerase [Balneolaceae bacterium]|nr:FKBP-type peptidyl-prolyl cis-trans isomerase [Balneolaceae bacterium]
MIHKKLVSGAAALAVILTFTLAGCKSGSYNGNVNLTNNIDSVSYAFGYLNGKHMSQQGMDDINPQIFAKAMNEAFAGDSSKISQTKLRAMLQRYSMQARQKMQKKQQKQAKANQKKGQAFLKKNKTKQGVKTTKSGLQYKILKKGSGPSPSKNDTVLVSYKGMHLNGKVFDQNDSVSIPLSRVFPGWQEGIQLMHEGARYKFWIPGKLAYGQHPRPGGPIAPDETLVFNVKLIKIKK